MSDTTVEQKMQLVRQVRSRYHENLYDMSNRERILYGRTSVTPEKMGYDGRYEDLKYGDSYGGVSQPAERSASFKVRLWVALFLALGLIYMDKNNLNVAGITTEKVFEVISADYEEVIETWVEALAR